MADAPQPLKTIACQSLLLEKVRHNGWLRKQSTIHKHLKLAVKLIPWTNKYVVVHKGCMYVFDNDMARKPQSAFSLFGYNSVNKAGEVLQADAPWAFKLVYVDPDVQPTRYFSASSERELKQWMIAIKREMMFANGKGTRVSSKSNYSEDDCDNLSFNDIEESVYKTRSELGSVSLEPNDSSDDSDKEYHEIEEEGLNRRPLPKLPEGDSPGNRGFHSGGRPPAVLPTTDSSPISQSGRSNRPPAMLPAKHEPSSNNSQSNFRSRPKLPSPLHTTETLESIQDSDDESELHNHHVPQSPGRPMPPIPTSPDDKHNSSPMRTGSKGIQGQVNQLAKMFSDKPVISTKPEIGLKKTHLNPGQERPQVSPRSRRKPEVIPDNRNSPTRQPSTENSGSDFLQGVMFDNPNKDEANRVLNEIGVEGVFLIRAGEVGQVLVVYAQGGARKYKIVENGNEVHISSEKVFSNLGALISYYKENKLPKRPTCLTQPYSKYKYT